MIKSVDLNRKNAVFTSALNRFGESKSNLISTDQSQNKQSDQMLLLENCREETGKSFRNLTKEERFSVTQNFYKSL